MLKTRVLMAMCLIVMVFIISACGNGGQKGGADSGNDIVGQNGDKTDGNNVGEAPANQQPVKKDPVDLYFYQVGNDWDEERYMREITEPIHKKFPHITPKFIKYTAADQLDKMITSGDRLDIISLSIGQVYNFLLKYELQTNIEPLIKKYDFDLNVFEQTSVDLLKQIGKGELYGLPMYTLPATIYYNKDLFEKFGVDNPKDGLTWDEFYELARVMTRKDGDLQYYGAVISPSHLALRNQLSLNLNNPNTELAAINTDQWKLFMDNITRFYQIPGYDWDNAEMQVGKQRDMFTKERRAATWLPVSTMHTAEELEGMNWDLATFPTMAQAPGVGPQTYPFYYFITNTSKHKDEAFEVLMYLSSKEFHMDKSKTGVFLSLLNDPEVRANFGKEAPMYQGKNTSALLPEVFAKPSYVNAYTAGVASQIFSAIVAVTTGVDDINSALRKGEEARNKVIEAELNK